VDTSLIPSLYTALIFAGDSESTLFEGQVIPKWFSGLFSFEDKLVKDIRTGKTRPKDESKKWDVRFKVAISEKGTPSLYSVEVNGSFKPLMPKPLKREEYPPDVFIPKKDFFIPKYDFSRSERELPNSLNRESVERWQLKLVEQYRFQMLELALWLAVSSVTPISEGNKTYWTLTEKSFNADEIREITKSISKRIRQKITPDFLKEVAEIYTEAGLNKDDPVQALMRRYKCAHRTASEYATKARNIGLLPPTEPGIVTVVTNKPKTKSKPKARKGSK
jgi:hypothetical protein